MFPVASTSQPYLLDSAINSVPRTRAWMFSSVVSRSCPAKLGARADSNASTIASIGISRKSTPSDSADALRIAARRIRAERETASTRSGRGPARAPLRPARRSAPSRCLRRCRPRRRRSRSSPRSRGGRARARAASARGRRGASPARPAGCSSRSTTAAPPRRPGLWRRPRPRRRGRTSGRRRRARPGRRQRSEDERRSPLSRARAANISSRSASLPTWNGEAETLTSTCAPAARALGGGRARLPHVLADRQADASPRRARAGRARGPARSTAPRRTRRSSAGAACGRRLARRRPRRRAHAL